MGLVMNYLIHFDLLFLIFSHKTILNIATLADYHLMKSHHLLVN